MNPIIFSGAHLVFVSAYDGVDYEQWNSTSGPAVELRRYIREHYLVQQDFRCAYCRMRRQELHGLVWDVEHILAKSKYPKHLYAPTNLALVCKECNIAKGDQEVLLSKFRARTKLAVESSDYLIVHPHFDVYSEHIDRPEFQGKVMFQAKSPKGKMTIYICDLLRFSFAYGGWDSFNDALVARVSHFIDKFPLEATSQTIRAAIGHIASDENVDFGE